MEHLESLLPSFRMALIEKMKTESPFWELLGMELIDVKKGWAKVRLPFARKLVHPLGLVHGGAIFSTADSAIAMALIGLVERYETFTTIEMKINYLHPFDAGTLIAKAKIIHKGSSTAVGDADVYNDRGRLVAKALATYMIMGKKP